MFNPPTLYDPSVPNCAGGGPQDMANQPVNVVVQQVDACTWTAAPALDSTTAYNRAGVWETQKGGKTASAVYGGQFHMPFLYRIQKLNCTP